MTGDTRTEAGITGAVAHCGNYWPFITIYYELSSYGVHWGHSPASAERKKPAIDLSIWRAWLHDRPLESLYQLPEIIRRRVLWLTRKFPAWKRGRWKAKS